ncbi:hypothetical protein JYU34_021560 [Plutella xylostella]|uniref:Uncharacterized protein n=1 Tax=Plutella xylostella TaxID=51655 RepID=A0ABQ7PTU5_PLUXY|nr:hypothetical protein JYU34_021560 [Plutella xylostella]
MLASIACSGRRFRIVMTKTAVVVSDRTSYQIPEACCIRESVHLVNLTATMSQPGQGHSHR